MTDTVQPTSPATAVTTAPKVGLVSLAARSFCGGLLMGVANVVPGISGGAMLLLVGIYHAFIGAIAQLTGFVFRLRPIVLLGAVGCGAVLAIMLSAGPIKTAIVDYRWQVFSLFIGLRLGAAPVVWKLCKPATPGVWAGVAGGIVITMALAVPQYFSSAPGVPLIQGLPGYFVAGLVGASATILPGMDGSYFLMLMGKYVPILSAVDAFKDGLVARDFAAMWAQVPKLMCVALGVGCGLAGVSVALRWLFRKYQKVTAGVLLGIVIGAFGGLWPFRQYVPPAMGQEIRGVIVTPENVDTIAKDHWPLAFFTPSLTQTLAAIGLIVVGYVLAILLARIDPGEEHLSAMSPAKSA